MKFVRAGLLEFLLFGAIVVVLIAAHSSRLDKAMIIAWALILIGGSVRLIYKRLGNHSVDKKCGSVGGREIVFVGCYVIKRICTSNDVMCFGQR